MVKTVNLEDVNVLLIEKNSEIRAVLRDGLRQRGIVKVTAVPTIEAAEKLLDEILFDIIIFEDVALAPETRSLAHAIRYGVVGNNPFQVLVTTMFSAEIPAVKRAINDGIDNILAKPFSALALIDRVTALIHSRKSFAVTASYIGPDRRLVPRAEVNLPLIEVPNTLRDKAFDRFDETRARSQIATARSTVNTQKLIHGAQLIASVTEQVAIHYESGIQDETVRVHLDLLLENTREIESRLANTPDAHVAELCGSFLKVLGDIRQNYLSPTKTEVSLMRNLGQAISASLKPDDKIAGLSKDIAGSVVEVRQRLARDH